jgi:hypothetical protein
MNERQNVDGEIVENMGLMRLCLKVCVVQQKSTKDKLASVGKAR